jgi:long-chain acyl-CoA synthetase
MGNTLLMGGTTAENKQGTGAEDLAAMMVEASRTYDGAALRYHDGDDWCDMSYEELGKATREIAGGLIALGIEAGQRVAILSETRPEWTLADLGGIQAAAHVVPIYQTASAEEAKHVLEDSEARLVFCEDTEKLETVREASEGLNVEHIVLFEGEDDGAITLDELREKGRDHGDEVDQRIEGIEPDDVFTLIYTSGTTGPPKGCILTHANYRANCEMLEQAIDIEDDEVFYIFLPLAHALSRMTQMATLDTGATLAFWRGDKDKALDDLREIKPTVFPSVPRIFEKIYEQAQEKGGSGIKGKLLDKAIDVGRKVRELERKGEEPGPVLKKEHELADKQILSEVRDLFGGNLRFAVTGAAPVDKTMLEFFDACGVLILEGYGATETSAVTTANRPDDFRFGTVGKAMEGSEVKLDDDTDDEGRAELLVKGPHVFQGYHNLDDETSESFDGEWFKTGDLATIDDDGFVTIAGRTKEIIVTSSGKNITPTNIEEKISQHSSVSQAVVYGDDRPYLVALIEADDGAGEDDVQKAIDEANNDLAKIEQVKKFKILDRELSQDEGELTPTLKLKREVVYDNFSDEIDALYDDEDDD